MVINIAQSFEAGRVGAGCVTRGGSKEYQGQENGGATSPVTNRQEVHGGKRVQDGTQGRKIVRAQ